MESGLVNLVLSATKAPIARRKNLAPDGPFGWCSAVNADGDPVPRAADERSDAGRRFLLERSATEVSRLVPREGAHGLLDLGYGGRGHAQLVYA
jgi:hypothetical protein